MKYRPKNVTIPGSATIAVSATLRKENPIDIKPGDSVHHPQHGIGDVLSITTRSFYGQAEAVYTEVHFKRDGLTLTMLESELKKTVRQLISAKEAKQLLADLEEWSGKPSGQWKARAKAHQAALDRANPFEYARVFKGLVQLEENENLRAQDRAHLNQSAALLTEELAFSLGKTSEQARKLLVRASGQ